jgi:NitT/TauT family transport system substrate-binding protein
MKLTKFRTCFAAGLLASLTTLALTSAVVPSRAETITVTHWGSAFYGAPYAIARAKGFFKKHGVDITGFLTATGGGTAVRNTLAGGLPFGEVALPAAIMAIQSGQPLKIVSGGVESVGDLVWVAKPNAPINGLSNIKGKKIAYTSVGSVSNMVLLMCLRKAGVDRSAVHLVAAGGLGSNLSAALNGAVDAGIVTEPLWSQSKGTVKAAFEVKDCTDPHITQTVGITTAEFAKSHGDTIRGIIAARREGVAFINSHTDEAADIVAKAYNGDAKLYRTVFKNLVAMDYFGDGTINYDNMDRMIDGMKLVGLLKGPVDWKAIVDGAFQPSSSKSSH